MKFLGYIMAYSIVWLLHLLPERILYIISDFLFLFVYHVAGYRRGVVINNITRAFPEYGNKEVRATAKKFYHHLCDLILESAVSHFYTESEARQKISYLNPELLDEIHGTGRQVMAVMGHYGNWEYLSTLSLKIKYPVLAIYKPLKNQYFDRMIKQNRTRFGAMVTPMEKVARKLIAFQQEGRPVLTIFLSDQRPMFHQIQYWTQFMGQDTPLYLGTEKLARKLDAAVVFFRIRKVRRGRYEMEVELISEDPGSLKPFEITEAHVRVLEEQIREEPGYWLWSHRRWKHSKERYLKEQAE